jgi:Protein of unknown function (DUF4238)
MQQHYLPKGAYLKFFEVPHKPGAVYLYQREKDIVLTGIHNVAKEKHLYSFTDMEGKLNTTLEAMLGEFENAATPILTRLGEARASLQISVDEFNTLMSFLSLQAVRTPAFRKTLEQVSAMHAKTVMQAYAQSTDSLRSIMEKTKAHRPEEDFPEISVDEMQKFILDESRYTIEVKGGDYFLGHQMKLQDDVFHAIVLKKIALLFSESEAFITSDHPVCLVPHPGVPPFYGGFRFSDVLFPISRRACLILITQKNQKALTNKSQEVMVLAMKASPPQVRETNKVTIWHSENFLFASENNKNIQKLFNKTSVPTRIHMDSPFSGKKSKPI